jgi:hypothetical protein
MVNYWVTMRQLTGKKYWLTGIMVALLVFGLSARVLDLPVNARPVKGEQPAASTTPPAPSGPRSRPLRAQDAWQIVYQKLPTLPLENQYVNRETGKIDPNNTLVSRLMRYHLYVKGRPSNYRFDWKLTLADYLGVNEPIEPLTYPGADALKQNPVEKDITIINQLDRSQRDELVQTLVNIFTPPTTQPNRPTRATPAPSPTPTPSARLTQPESGGARLLLP